MADLSKYNDGTNEYNFKDATARASISTIEDKIPSAASSSNKLVDTTTLTTELNGKVNVSSVGANNGVAELDSNGRVPSSQLPSYVDDVLEYASQSAFPATGETGKIYIALDTNKTYRWSGSAYVEISESLALGETSSTAYAGNKGKANADAIAAMKDGSSIDSFGDVETALAGKADKFGVDGWTIDWLQGVGVPNKLYVMEHDEIPQEGTESSGLPSDTAIRKAVKSAYNLMEDTVGWSGKNLYDLVATSKTDQYGGIWTVNDDKTITVSGTPTNYEPFSTRSYKVLPVGSYILSWDNTNVVNASIDTIRLYKDNTQVRKIPIPNALLPVAFNITVEDDYDRINVAFKRYTNNEPMSGTIKPMIRKSTILDDTYEPYRGTTAFPRDEQAVLGAKNLLVYPYKGSKNENGVIFTNNEDGTINVNGTATSYSDYSFHNRTADPLNLPAGKYYISGGISSAINIVVGRTYNGSFQELAVSTGTDAEFTVTEGDNLGISLRVNQNAEANNITIKPMIRLATDTDDTYVPYAMTNRELTDAVTSRTVAITTDANTLTKEGTYLYTSLITDAPTIHLPSEITNRYARIEVKTINGTSQLTQVLYTHNKTDFWTRALNNGTFTNWFKFSGTEVTP